MIRSIISYPLRFLFLVFLQVVVLNNIQLSGYINPFVYILFVLWLPIETNRVVVMLISFVLGLVVDLFSDTMGMHASACVFMAFVRPWVLSILAPRDGYEPNQTPSIQQFGLVWFLTYVSLCIFLHHLFLFFVEVFRFSDFLNTIGRVFVSSFFTLIVVLMIEYFHYNAEDKK